MEWEELWQNINKLLQHGEPKLLLFVSWVGGTSVFVYRWAGAMDDGQEGRVAGTLSWKSWDQCLRGGLGCGQERTVQALSPSRRAQRGGGGQSLGQLSSSLGINQLTAWIRKGLRIAEDAAGVDSLLSWIEWTVSCHGSDC